MGIFANMEKQMSKLIQALDRHKAAQAALDAGPEDRPKHLFDSMIHALH
jgi:hypothetical protein